MPAPPPALSAKEIPNLTERLDIWVAERVISRADADAITRFDSNESRFRLESPALAIVRRPEAVYVVGAS